MLRTQDPDLVKPMHGISFMLSCALSVFTTLLCSPYAKADTDSLMNSAKSHFDEGDFEASHEFLKEALSKESSNTARYALCLQNLALLEYLDFHFQESEKLYLKAIAACESLYGSDCVAVANNLYGLSRCLRRTNRLDEAERCLNRLLLIRSKLFGEDHALVANTLMDIAVNYDREGKNLEAEQFYQRVINLREKQYGKDSRSLSPGLSQYAKFLRKVQKDEKASQIEARLLDLTHGLDTKAASSPGEDNGSGWQNK